MITSESLPELYLEGNGAFYPSAPTLHWLRTILGDFLLCFLAAPTDCRSLSHWRGLEADSWKVPRGTTERVLAALEESVFPLHSPFLLLKVEIMTRAAEGQTHPHSTLNTAADEAWLALGYFGCYLRKIPESQESRGRQDVMQGAKDKSYGNISSQLVGRVQRGLSDGHHLLSRERCQCF